MGAAAMQGSAEWLQNVKKKHMKPKNNAGGTVSSTCIEIRVTTEHGDVLEATVHMGDRIQEKLIAELKLPKGTMLSYRGEHIIKSDTFEDLGVEDWRLGNGLLEVVKKSEREDLSPKRSSGGIG